MNFTPPKLAIPAWATYVPGRSPEFKAHTNRGYALSAITQGGQGIIYYVKDNEWIEWNRIEREANPEKCDNCQGKYPGRTWVDLKTDAPFMA